MKIPESKLVTWGTVVLAAAAVLVPLGTVIVYEVSTAENVAHCVRTVERARDQAELDRHARRKYQWVPAWPAGTRSTAERPGHGEIASGQQQPVGSGDNTSPLFLHLWSSIMSALAPQTTLTQPTSLYALSTTIGRDITSTP